MENRRKIFIRRHARSKLERRVEMTCDRGIVSFSDKIVQDGETKGKKNFPLLSLPSLVRYRSCFRRSFRQNMYIFNLSRNVWKIYSMNNETQSRILTRGIFHLLFNAYIISNAEFL